jgi:hypothetical protein
LENNVVALHERSICYGSWAKSSKDTDKLNIKTKLVSEFYNYTTNYKYLKHLKKQILCHQETVPDQWDKVPDPEDHWVFVQDMTHRAIRKALVAEWEEVLDLEEEWEEVGVLAEASAEAGILAEHLARFTRDRPGSKPSAKMTRLLYLNHRLNRLNIRKEILKNVWANWKVKMND